MTTYARIRPIIDQRRENRDQAFLRLAELLRGTGKVATLRCTILSDTAREHWTLDLHGDECRLLKDVRTAPNLELICKEATFWEIADGKLSPIEAFLQGRLRILGDTKLATHLLRHLADGDGATSIFGG
jgi:putative sterol carrier protein